MHQYPFHGLSLLPYLGVDVVLGAQTSFSLSCGIECVYGLLACKKGLYLDS